LLIVADVSSDQF